MVKSILIDYTDELTELVQRMDYIIGQYESEDSDICKPMRKIENQMLSHISALQRQIQE